MEKLWAPWRMEYIKKEKDGECIFCTFPSQNQDEKNYILHRGNLCFIIMNTYPYSNGHLMICPYKHLACLSDLNSEEITEIGELTQICIKTLKTVYQAQGFNIGVNLGNAGGAGIEEHVHVHIVPRWIGDTNFMPVLGEIKVHPEHLRDSYKKLQPVFKRLP